MLVADNRNRKCESHDEHFRQVFLKTNVKEERLLGTALSHIDREKRRRAMHSLQKKREFLLSIRQKPDPIIIVERPASPRIIQKAHNMKHGVEEEEEAARTPRYMRPRKSQMKMPNTLTTLDAYSVRASKKANLWEPKVTLDGGMAKFSCRVPPSYPLNKDERLALHQGWQYHRPKTPSTPILPPRPKDRKERKPKRRVQAASKTFITELPTLGERDAGSKEDVDRQAIHGVQEVNQPDTDPKQPFLQIILDKVSETAETTPRTRMTPLERPQSSPRLGVKSRTLEKPRSAEDDTFLTQVERKGIEDWLQRSSSRDGNVST